MSLFAEQPPVLFGGRTVQQRSRFGTSLAPERALLPASRQMVMELQKASQPETFTQLVEDSYGWFSNSNRVEAAQYLQGAHLAYQMELPHQIRHYTDKLVEVYTRDMADRTSALRLGQMGATPFRHYFTDRAPVSQRTFTIPIESKDWRVQLQWVVAPLVQFPQIIPVHALQALAALEQASIVPDGFWVADKVEVVRPRVSLDPILCCNFDRWFVGLAQWE